VLLVRRMVPALIGKKHVHRVVPTAWILCITKLLVAHHAQLAWLPLTGVTRARLGRRHMNANVTVKRVNYTLFYSMLQS
jgi:hypothetical protein